MYNRLLKYLTLNKILVENQFGFRQRHSTYMALLKLVNDITEELDKGNCSIGIFIDLSKAFDAVDHKLLLRKMEHYGIRGNALFGSLATYHIEPSMYHSIRPTLKVYL